jgi:acyl dehydratase
VHADESFTYVRPIVAGDELTAELEVTNVRAVRGNSMLQATTVITDAEGSEVVTAYATLVVGGQEDDR